MSGRDRRGPHPRRRAAAGRRRRCRWGRSVGPLVASKPRQLGLGQPATCRPTPYTALQLGRGHPRRRAAAIRARPWPLGVPGGEQGLQREGCVAQPAVAVVPVPHAADPLGQRGRRCGDDAAGRCVRQRLQGDREPLDRSGMGHAAWAASGPLRCRTRRCRPGRVRGSPSGAGQMAGRPRSGRRAPGQPARDREVADRAQVLAPQGARVVR